MPYFTQDYCDKFIGKQILKITPGTGSIVIRFVGGDVLRIDACVEHERVDRSVNLIANTERAGDK